MCVGLALWFFDDALFLMLIRIGSKTRKDVNKLRAEMCGAVVYVHWCVWWSWDADVMMHDADVDAMRILVHEMWAAAVANLNTLESATDCNVAEIRMCS